MKTIIKFVALIFVVTLQNCNAQNVGYQQVYNNIATPLQKMANNKTTQFYNSEFKYFSKSLIKNNLIIKSFGYDSKMATRPEIFVLSLYFTDMDARLDLTEKKLKNPFVVITFQNQIPDDIIGMTLKYHGEWNDEFEKFFSDMKIEKINFYDINGFQSKDRGAR